MASLKNPCHAYTVLQQQAASQIRDGQKILNQHIAFREGTDMKMELQTQLTYRFTSAMLVEHG
jgi:hypothetical protein